MEKEIKSRIQQKHDYEINWLKAVNFIPKKGEIIVYDVEVDENGEILTFENGTPVFVEGQGLEGKERFHPFTQSRQKIGDGVRNVNDLPFSTPSIYTGEGIDSITQGSLNEAVGYLSHAEGGNTKSVGEYSHASGMGSIAGCKGYYISAVDLDNKQIYLSNTKIETPIIGAGTIDETFETPAYDFSTTDSDGYAHPDSYWQFSIINGSHFDMLAKIISVNHNVVTYEGDIGFTEIMTDSAGDGHTFRVPAQPTIGVIEISPWNSASGAYTRSSGRASHAEGYGNIVAGDYSHGEGIENIVGYSSHAEGRGNKILGYYNHGEGRFNKTGAKTSYAHVEGLYAEAHGEASHAEDSGKAYGKGAHAEGNNTKAYGPHSHTEGSGSQTTETANGAHAEGNGYAENTYAHAEGRGTHAQGFGSHAEGLDSYTTTDGLGAHAEGRGSYAKAEVAHAEGYQTQATAQAAHSEGYQTYATGIHSHAEGKSTHAEADQAHAEGMSTYATSQAAHAEGRGTHAEGSAAHAEGGGTYATEKNAHAEGDATAARADNAHAEGWGTIVTGNSGHAEGRWSWATNYFAHAEGEGATAAGRGSHAEGGAADVEYLWDEDELDPDTGTPISVTKNKIISRLLNTESAGEGSHAEGIGTLSLGKGAHAEGGFIPSSVWSETGDPDVTANEKNHNISYEDRMGAKGDYSHTEGLNTLAAGEAAHAEGTTTAAVNVAAHAEGFETSASGESAHSEGRSTWAEGNTSHAEGRGTHAIGQASHAEGCSLIDNEITYFTEAQGEGSHAEGAGTHAEAEYSHTEGKLTTASQTAAHAEGWRSQAKGQASHAEGGFTIAEANYAHAEGIRSNATGEAAHAEGRGTHATAKNAHAEGFDSYATAEEAHAEGKLTQALGYYSHSEGISTRAFSEATHAEGYQTQAGVHESPTGAAWGAHAEGMYTQAKAQGSHAAGRGTIAEEKYQYVIGTYNTNDSNAIFIVGNGSDDNNRSNSHTIDKNGNAWFAGNVTIGNDKQILATEANVDNKISIINADINNIESYLGLDKNYVTIESGLEITVPEGAKDYAMIDKMYGATSSYSLDNGYNVDSPTYVKEISYIEYDNIGDSYYEESFYTFPTDILTRLPDYGYNPQVKPNTIKNFDAVRNYIYFEDGRAYYHQGLKKVDYWYELQEGEILIDEVHDTYKAIALPFPIVTDITNYLNFDGVVNQPYAVGWKFNMNITPESLDNGYGCEYNLPKTIMTFEV